MATELQLDIVTPAASVFSGSASELIIPAWDGELGIYPAHDTLLALLRAGSCTVTTAQGSTRYVLGRGFDDIGSAKVTLLTDSCETADSIDRAEARERLSAAETRLAECQVFTEAHNQATIALEHAKARANV